MVPLEKNNFKKSFEENNGRDCGNEKHGKLKSQTLSCSGSSYGREAAEGCQGRPRPGATGGTNVWRGPMSDVPEPSPAPTSLQGSGRGERPITHCRSKNNAHTTDRRGKAAPQSQCELPIQSQGRGGRWRGGSPYLFSVPDWLKVWALDKRNFRCILVKVATKLRSV